MAKRLIPSFNRILVEKIVPPSKTSAGILLPEKSSQVSTNSLSPSFVFSNRFWFGGLTASGFDSKQLNSGKVVAVGPGSRDRAGNLIPVAVKEGDHVLLPEYGGTQIKLDDKEYVIGILFLFFGCVCLFVGLNYPFYSNWDLFYLFCRFHLFRDEDILGILRDWCRQVCVVGLENANSDWVKNNLNLVSNAMQFVTNTWLATYASFVFWKMAMKECFFLCCASSISCFDDANLCYSNSIFHVSNAATFSFISCSSYSC